MGLTGGERSCDVVAWAYSWRRAAQSGGVRGFMLQTFPQDLECIVPCGTMWGKKSAPYVQSKWDERRSAGLKLIFIGRKQDGPLCQLRWEKRAKRMALRLFPSTSALSTASARLAAAAARSLSPNLGINKPQCSPLRGNHGGKMFHVEHCDRIITHHQHQKPTSLSPLGGKRRHPR